MNKLLTLLAALGLALGLAQAPADTLVIQTLPGGPVSLDPARAYDSASGWVLNNVYETLYGYDGEAIDEFVPLLATDYSVSDDGMTWTFTLRDGVQFHSGNSLSCKDVEYSYEYGFVAASSEGANVYLMGDALLGRHDVDGSDPAAYQEAISYEMIDNAVECPDGPDGMTVQFNLAQADPAFLAIQAYTAFSILDSEFAKAGGAWDGTADTWADWVGRDLTQEYLHTNVSGTGAYRVVEWTDQQTILERFDGYWGFQDMAEVSAPKNVIIQYVEEQSSRILAIQQGDADYISVNDRPSLVQLQGAPGVVVMENPDWSVAGNTIVFFNMDIDTENNEDVGSGQLDGNGIPSDFFADVNVRRGFAHLFDHQAFIEQMYGGSGTALTVGMPRSFLGYNPDIDIRTLDLEKAEEYFRAAFGGELWEKGFEFTALHNAGNTVRQTALEIIAENLSFLNPKFRMNVRSLPWADYLARTGEKKAPMFALGWGADYADPKNFIDTFYSNTGFYSARTSIDIPEIQALIDEANSIADPEERAFIYREIANLHYDLAPLIVVPEQAPFLVVSERLQGAYRNPMISSSGSFYIKDVSLQ